MPNLWGVPIWVLSVCGLVTAVPTLWKISRGTVRGPLAISLSGLASVLEAAAFVSLVLARPVALHLQFTALFTLLSWLLETWAKRVKLSQKHIWNEGVESPISASESGTLWYSK